MANHTESSIKTPPEADHLYRWVFEDHPLGFFLLDHSQVIIKVNPTFARMLGYEINELIGESLVKIIVPEELTENLELAKKIHAGKINDVTVEGSYLSKDGRKLPSRSLIKAIFDKNDLLKYCLATVIDIQGEKKKESALKISQDLWKTVYDSSPLGIAIVDPFTQRFIEVNRSFQEIVGYTKSELLATTTLDISPTYQHNGEKSEDVVKRLNNLMPDGPQTYIEWLHTHKNGEERFLQISMERIKQDDQTLILTLAHDITEKKRQEINLRKSEDRFRNLYHNNPLMLFTIDLGGKVLAVNQSAVDQLGYQEHELIGNDVIDVFHIDDQSELKSKMAAFLVSDNAEATWELRKVRKSGEVIWVREIVKYIDWQDGRSLLISCENISARVEAERIRKRSEDRYRSIFESNLLGIAITDFNGYFEIVNPAFCQMLGYNQEELASLDSIQITAEEDRERTRAISGRLREENTQLIMEKKYLRKDGSALHARTFAKAMEEECQTKSLIVIQDISDEKKVLEQERELTDKDDQLNYKNRELTSYTLFLTQKTELLKQISSSLSDIAQDCADGKTQSRLQKLSGYVEQNIDREKTWREFQIHFQQVNPLFLQNLKTQFPLLTSNELKHCAYVVMRLSNTDVANLLHVTPKAIEVARYRIKKKLGLADRGTKLSDFLHQFI